MKTLFSERIQPLNELLNLPFFNNLWHTKNIKIMMHRNFALILILDIMFVMYHRRWRGGKGTEHDIRPSGNKIAQNDFALCYWLTKKNAKCILFYDNILLFMAFFVVHVIQKFFFFLSFSLFSIKKEKWWSEMEIDGNER